MSPRLEHSGSSMRQRSSPICWMRRRSSLVTETHFVEVPCSCENIEQCVTELYISDVRILIAALETAEESAHGNAG